MRTSIRRPIVVIPALAVLALGVSACSQTEGGSPIGGTTPPTATSGVGGPFPTGDSPQPSTSTSPSVGAGPLAGRSPCSLLSAAELSPFNAEPGKEEKQGYGRKCQYRVPEGTLSVTIFDTLGTKDIQGTNLTPVRIGNHDAVRSEFGATCAFSLATTPTSRVDAAGTHISGNEQKSCDFATQLAQLVEPKLP